MANSLSPLERVSDKLTTIHTAIDTLFKHIIIIKVILIHMYMIPDFQQGQPLAANLFAINIQRCRSVVLVCASKLAKPVSLRTPSLLRRILLARSVITAAVLQ